MNKCNNKLKKKLKMKFYQLMNSIREKKKLMHKQLKKENYKQYEKLIRYSFWFYLFILLQKEARKRLDKKRNTDIGTEGGDNDYDQVNIEKKENYKILLLLCSKDDVGIVNEEEILVPEKPEPRKPDEIRTTILTKYQSAIRPSGRHHK